MTEESTSDVKEEVKEVSKEETKPERYLDTDKSKESAITMENILKGIPEEFRDKDLDNKYKSPTDFYLGMKSLQKMIGSDKVSVPDSDDSDEDKLSAHRKFSGVENIEKFDLGEVEDFDEDTLDDFKQAAFDNGLSPLQARNMLKSISAINDSVDEEDEFSQEDKMLKWESETLDMFGGELTESRASVKRAVSHLGQSFLESMGDDIYNPHLQGLLKNYGDTLAEASFGKDGKFFAGSDIKTAQREVDDLRGSLLSASPDERIKLDRRIRSKVLEINNMRRSA